jgi:hypothetical protein
MIRGCPGKSANTRQTIPCPRGLEAMKCRFAKWLQAVFRLFIVQAGLLTFGSSYLLRLPDHSGQ